MATLLGGITESDSTYCIRCYCSVVCLYVHHLSHSCTMRKPMDGTRCHLAGTFV